MISYPSTLVSDVTGLLSEENMPFEEESEPTPDLAPLCEAKVLIERWRRDYNSIQGAKFTGLQSPCAGNEAVLLACFRSALTDEQYSHENDRTLSRVTGVIRGGRGNDQLISLSTDLRSVSR